MDFFYFIQLNHLILHRFYFMWHFVGYNYRSNYYFYLKRFQKTKFLLKQNKTIQKTENEC